MKGSEISSRRDEQQRRERRIRVDRGNSNQVDTRERKKERLNKARQVKRRARRVAKKKM